MAIAYINMNKTTNIIEEEFESLTHGKVLTSDIVSHIKSFLEEDPSATYSLVIGTDSQERIHQSTGKKQIHLVTALVVYRRGYGGRYFWKRKFASDIHTLRQKVYEETSTSLEFASVFVPILQKSLNGKMPKYNLEIHIDVGEHGETRSMIKEVVGMVTGSGYVAKTKPFAYGASNIADKHT